jgi:hypothetical protein
LHPKGDGDDRGLIKAGVFARQRRGGFPGPKASQQVVHVNAQSLDDPRAGRRIARHELGPAGDLLQAMKCVCKESLKVEATLSKSDFPRRLEESLITELNQSLVGLGGGHPRAARKPPRQGDRQDGGPVQTSSAPSADGRDLLGRDQLLHKRQALVRRDGGFLRGESVWHKK